MAATFHLIVGLYLLIGLLLAIYLNINIFFVNLQGIPPFLAVVAALFAVSDIAEGLVEFIPKNKDKG